MSNYWAEKGKLRAMCGEANLDLKPDEESLEYICQNAHFNCGERTDCMINFINAYDTGKTLKHCTTVDNDSSPHLERYNLMVMPTTNDYSSGGYNVTGAIDHKGFANCIMYCSTPRPQIP